MKTKILLFLIISLLALKNLNAQTVSNRVCYAATLNGMSDTLTSCYIGNNGIQLCNRNIDNSTPFPSIDYTCREISPSVIPFTKIGTANNPSSACFLSTNLNGEIGALNLKNFGISTPIYKAPLVLEWIFVAAGQNISLNTTCVSNRIIQVINPVPWIATHPSKQYDSGCTYSRMKRFSIIDSFPTRFNNQYQWQQSQGDSSHFVNVANKNGNSSTFIPDSTKSGTFYYRCIVTNQFTCSSISYSSAAYKIKPNNVISNTSVTLCLSKGSSYTWAKNNKSYFLNTKDTTYKDTISVPLGGGCDSVYTLTLTINRSYQDTVALIYCSPYPEPYIWNGISCATSGYYTKTLKTVATKCDSIITLNLTYNGPPTSVILNPRICQGSTYTLNNKAYTQTGTYKDTLRNLANTCDSIRYTINLIVNVPTSSDSFVNICNNKIPFYWNGNNYNTSGNYTIHKTNVAGCDSSLTLHLTVRDTSFKYDTVRYCDGTSGYVYNGQTYTAGLYSIKLSTPNAAGCDSIVKLNVIKLNKTFKDTVVYVCRNCTYTWTNGITYTHTGNYNDTLIHGNKNGCDSIRRLHLFVGQIIGDTVVCAKNTAHFSVGVPVEDGIYMWSVSSGGVLTTTNPSATMTAVFDTATSNDYVVLSAYIYTPPLTYTLLYTDTLHVQVALSHIPSLATKTGVGCLALSDSALNELGQWVIKLDSSGCTNVCEKTKYTYFAIGKYGSTYDWQVTGGAILAQAADSIVVKWDSTGKPAFISLSEQTLLGCIDSVIYCFNIVPGPKSEIYTTMGKKDTLIVCRNQITTFIDSSRNSSTTVIKDMVFDFGDGSSVVPIVPYGTASHAFTNTGYFFTTLTVTNGCDCKVIDTVVVYVTTDTGVNIICERTVCENSTQYYSLDIPNISGCNLNAGWSVQGGHIIDTLGNTIQVIWDSVGSNGMGVVSFNSSICPYLCPGNRSIIIGIIKTTGIKVIGDSVVCSNKPYKYSLPFWNNTSYSWTATNGAVLQSTGYPNEVWVTANSFNGSNFMLNCHFVHNVDSCSGDASMNISILPQPKVVATNGVICLGSVDTLIATNTSGSWQWVISLPNNTTNTINGTSDTLIYNPTIAGDYIVNITSNAMCGSSSSGYKFTVLQTPQLVDSIIGVDSVCMNQIYTYKIAHTKQGDIYNWSVSNGGVITGQTVGNEVVMQFNTGSNWQVQVNTSNMSGCVNDSIKVLNVVPGIYARDLEDYIPNVCPDTRTTYTAKYKEAENYQWSIQPSSAGSIESGQGTSTITVLWNHNYTGSSATIRLQIRKCGNNLTPYNATVSFAPKPNLEITIPDSVCNNSSFTATLSSNPTVSNPTVLWNFGDAHTGTGSTYNYSYNSLIQQPKTFNITATLSGFTLNGCNYSNSVSIVKPIVVKPSPGFTTNGFIVDLCSATGIYTQDTTRLTINPNYGDVTNIVWTANGVSTSCSAPFGSSCLYYVASGVPIAGHYSVTLGNNYGCSTSDNITVFHYNCPAPLCTSDSGKPSITITGDTILGCGVLNLTAQTSYITNTHHWYINGPVAVPDYNENNVSVSNRNIILSNIGRYRVGFTAYFQKLQGTDTVLCSTDTGFTVVVPVLPKLSYTVQCSNGSYNLILGDYTTYLSGVINVSYDYYIDNVLIQQSNSNSYSTTISAGATHTAKVVVHYTYNGTAYSCATAVTTIAALPVIPTAQFTVSSKHCQNIPIQFTYSGTYQAGYSYLWDFGNTDQSIVQDPAWNYSQAISYTPRLTINNGYCTVVDSINLSIVQNRLNGTMQPTGNFVICPNTSLNLSFVNSGNTNPATFKWYDARKVDLLVPYATTTTDNINIGSDGSYWLKVEDNDGCYLPLTNNATIKVAQLQTPAIVSYPAAINNTLNVCVNNAFSLFSQLTDVSTVTSYSWMMNGVVVSSGAGNNSLYYASNTLSPGTYVFTVTTTQDLGTGSSCDMQSVNFTVIVNPAPTKPVIQNPTALDCRNYTIGLTATSSTAGIFNWNTGYSSMPGVTTSSTTVNTGGVYIVTLTNGLLCSSSDTVIVPHSAASYFADLAKGCYKQCLPANGLTIPLNSPSPVFSQWQWLLNWQPYTGGINSTVQPLTVLSSGTYTLVANNGLCTDTALNAILEFSQPQNCVKEQSCNFSINIGSVVWGATHDTVYVTYSITNNNNAAIPYTLNGGMLGAGVNGGIAPVGLSTHTTILLMPLGGAGSTNFTFTFYYTLGNSNQQCSQVVDICLDDCLPTHRIKNSAAIAKNTLQTSSNLWVYPTVAHNIANIVYEIKNIKDSKYLLSITDVNGRIVARYDINEKGRLSLNTSSWPTGLYFIQIADNGTIVQTEKLLIVRK